MGKLFRQAKGFTLLELLMVVIIVGVLASLALPQYSGFIEKARAAEATATIGAIKNAEALYKLESSNYSSSLTDLGMSTVPTAGDAQYWTYGVAGTAGTSYAVTATRSGKKAAGQTSKTIILTWTDANTPPEVWSGTHTGVPK